MEQDIVLALVVAVALAFDFTNGFHDTANAMATSIATRAMPPRAAVALAAVLNFVGAFLSLKVAATIAEDIVDAGAITPTIVFAGLLGGIFWNLITWHLGLPSSSSHALIGGVVGAVLVAAGTDAILVDGLVGEVLAPAVVAPVLALSVAAIATFVVYRMIARRRERTARGFRLGQLASASLVALSHGTNDAQKTMGVITLAMIANGTLEKGAAELRRRAGARGALRARGHRLRGKPRTRGAGALRHVHNEVAPLSPELPPSCPSGQSSLRGCCC